ncbi:baseplate J/gp47 family protein [Methylobacterium gnaphalii]|uniref:Baseplate J-like central domain-containing protein n=1 Tax=Methylobacterium gnaphalii TaxID=1010610 RepID=A0A512JPE9_9HYPH|nr:baseplate J/gp47 family protein [Methylobacterium gnaphalii]GEP11819.1 hypothetical protein MGN01_36640 [Methylobacterium gnaphalii]GJD70863.1 hypothetical protein MMMDOFMJ_3816 [Methylobacterium gnaphalii]GLS49546.1 hypothetical protein GCM10007885_23950 [Methylobacterium gnaphalii]
MPTLPPAVTAALSRFAAIDLARLPDRPVTARGYDAIYAAYMADLASRLNAEGIPYNVAGTPGNVVNLATDTYAITGRAFGYAVEAVEAAIDDAVYSVLVPWSFGPYLDALGAGQTPPVGRKAIVANPRPYVYGTDSVDDWQPDDVYRALILLAPEALSTCGPEGAYVWFTLEVPGVLSAGCYGPMSFGGTRLAPFVPLGEVRIPVLANAGDGTASTALVAAVQAAVSADSRRPIADLVTASAATVLPWSFAATLYCGPGVDLGAVGMAAYSRLRALADFQHRPGGSVLLQDVFAACKVPDATGTPLVGFVDPGSFADVNPGPVSAANPSPAFVAPYCAPPGPEGVTQSAGDDGTLLIVGGDIALRVEQTYG